MQIEKPHGMAQVGADLKLATALLNADELVAIPTETVYGLAGNALSTKAVAKIFEVKDRPHFDPLIVHFSGRAKISEYVMDFPHWAEKLAEAFWPGPLTLVLRKKTIIPDLVTAGRETVAVRVPNHSLTLELLHALPFPLAAPSANPFGYVSPTSAKHVVDQLGDRIQYILEGGLSSVGIESTIVADIDGTPTILRLGGTSIEAIDDVIGDEEELDFMLQEESQTSIGRIAPGMMTSHYAPHIPVFIGDPDPEIVDMKSIATLRFNKAIRAVALEKQIVLSQSGDLGEAATHLFSALRDLDRMNVVGIYAELVPNVGLGRAINDRLLRASVRGI